MCRLQRCIQDGCIWMLFDLIKQILNCFISCCYLLLFVTVFVVVMRFGLGLVFVLVASTCVSTWVAISKDTILIRFWYTMLVNHIITYMLTFSLTLPRSW